ncbi:MAG: hypothetical protein Q8N28_00980 [bacterium]|nr:hypothetical protein [bacterium]
MKKKITTIEDLAVLVQGEFLNVDKNFKELRNEMGNGFRSLRNEILEIKSDLEDLKLRMGEMVFRFEIQDVERRLKRVEEKIGLK